MKKFLIRLFVAALVVFQIWNLYIFLNPPIKTQMIRYGTLEDASVHQALLIRDESVITANGSGILESYVREYELVKNGKQVAAVYQGDVDSETQQKLKQVNDRITEITNTVESDTAFEGDQHKLEENIAVRASDLVVAANRQDAERASELRTDLDKLLDKKRAVSGESGTASAILEELRQQKQQYESMLSSTRQELYAPKPGLYSTAIDGYEQVLTPAAIGSMTVADFENIQGMDISAEQARSNGAVCKVVSNIEWNAALLMDAETAESIRSEWNSASQNGLTYTVYLRLDGQTQDSPATIQYISPASDGKCVLIATATDYNEPALSNRKCSITLIRDKYEGLKVPMEAIRVKDGQQGVYTVTDGLMKFKKTEILYNNGQYAIVKENNLGSNTLLLYDEVVVDAKEINEGALVR